MSAVLSPMGPTDFADLVVTWGRRATRDEDACLARRTPTGLLAAVFDGHRGAKAARWCSKYISHLISDEVEKGLPMSEALASALAAANSRLDGSSGTTATIIILQELHCQQRATCAWVGDSRAILVRSDGKALEVTTDHRVELEFARLESLGVNPVGGRIGGLQVSRSLGDRITGVSPMPMVAEFTLNRGEAMVVASDGLWDVVNPEEVGAMVLESPREAAVALAEEASRRYFFKRRRADDITVCVIYQLARSVPALTVEELMARRHSKYMSRCRTAT